MLGLIAGGALAAAGSIFAGASNKRSAERQQRLLEAEKAKEQMYYDKKYNEDPLSRSDSQAAMRYAREQAEKMIRREAGSAVVAGSTTASESVAKEKANEMVSQTASNITAGESARRDLLDEQHMQNQSNFLRREAGVESAKSKSTADAIKGVTGAAGNIFMASDLWGNNTESSDFIDQELQKRISGMVQR